MHKSWKLQAERKIFFQLPLLSSSKHKSEAPCLFCFCYHSCMKKCTLKVCLQWLGEHEELSEAIQKEETQSSVLSHGDAVPSPGFCRCLSPWWLHVSHRVHPLLGLCPLQHSLPEQISSFFTCVPLLARRTDKLGTSVSLRGILYLQVLWKGAACEQRFAWTLGGRTVTTNALREGSELDRTGGPALRGVRSRSKLFSTGFHSGNFSFPRSIPKECQWLIHFQ